MNSDLKKLQKFIDGDWKHIADARNACENNKWKEFLLKAQPQPFFLNVIAYFNYKKCLDKCMQMLKEVGQVEIKFFPVWYGNNMDDTASKKWQQAYLIKMGNERSYLADISASNLKKYSLDFNSVITLKAKMWNAATVGKSRNYAPGIKLVMRGLIYCVVDIDVIKLEEIVNQEILEVIPKPTHEIPPFSTFAYPGLKNYPDEILNHLKSYEIIEGEATIK